MSPRRSTPPSLSAGSESPVGELGGGNQSHPHAVLILGHSDAVPVGGIGIASGNSSFRMAVPELLGQPHPGFSLVEAVVVGSGNEIEAQVQHGFAHLRRGAEPGIVGERQFRACQHCFLVDKGKVRLGNNGGDGLIGRGEVIAIAAGTPGRLHPDHIVDQIVPGSHQRHLTAHRLRERIPVLRRESWEFPGFRDRLTHSRPASHRQPLLQGIV